MGILDYTPTYSDPHTLVYRLSLSPTATVGTNQVDTDTAFSPPDRLGYDFCGLTNTSHPVTTLSNEELRAAYWAYWRSFDRQARCSAPRLKRQASVHPRLIHFLPRRVKSIKPRLPSTRAHRRAVARLLRGA